MPINTTSFLNTPQAGDDLFTSVVTGLTEDSLFIAYLAVMANDLGGAAKTLYSIDNGTNSVGVLSPTDLLTQDIVRTEALSTDLSTHGAKIWITADGKVGYDAATLSAAFKDQLQHLSAGQCLTDTFTYAIRLGNGTLSWATATVQIAGVNDAPVVTGAVTCSTLEDGSSVTLDALANASDVDTGATLSVTNLPGTLPPGVTYNALTHSFTLDASNAAFQHLAAGDHTTVTVNYGVSDGTTTTATSMSWDVTGINDAPVVTGAVTGAATEDAASVTVNALANASDVDDGTVLSVTNLPGALPPGVTYNAVTHSFALDPSNAAFQHLAAGEHTTVTVNYGVTDGTATTAATVSWNVTGTNDAPVITSNGGGATATLSVNENSTAVTTVTATDADDGATQTYSIVGGNDAALFTIDASTGALSFISAPDREAPTDSNSDNVYNVTVRVSDGVSFDDQAMTVSINDVNEFSVTTPADTNTTANAVDENSAIGTVVGVTAHASDADATTHTVSYSLIDNAGGKFAIDGSTGVVTVAGAIDREVDASLNITVRATSADGSTADKVFTIAVNDVNEFAVTTPVDSNAAANAINENVAIGTVVGITASSSDADATNHAVSYSLSSNPGGLFAIDATTGVVTTAAAIDREALGASVDIEVTATSADASTAVQSFSIAINDVNEFSVTTPVDTNVVANAVDENVAIGTVVGITASSSDADATTNAVTYSLHSNPGGLFAIDATTGVVTTAAAIDREALGASVNIEVTATSADTSTAVQTFSIAINDVNEFTVTTPTDTNVAANAVDENVAVGTVVGVTAFASDADATTHTVSYSLTDSAGGKFAIDGNTGVVTVAGAIDREVDASLNITVRATSADGSTADKVFAIAVNDVNEFAVTTPVDSNAAANAVDENVAVGTVVGITAHASDADATTNGVTYALTSNPGGLFAIDATTGMVTTAAAIDREALGASVNIEVTATSADTSTAVQTFSIAINDVNEFSVTTPTDTNVAANAVDENVAVGTVVGVTAHASDADATNHSVSYSLTDSAGGKFAIDATSGVVTVAGAIDREVKASLNITVRATSADGSTADKVFTIAVNDVNEFAVTTPVDANGAANAINENVAIGTVVGITASSSDADATNHAVSYSLSSNPGGLFAIDAATGVVTTAATIDREALGASVDIEVTATSADASTAVQSFGIAINDINEFAVTTPVDSNAAANAVDENSAIGTVVGVTAFASDADATNHAVSYSLTDSAGGKFAIDGSTGVVTVAGAIDREVDASLNITVRATSADGSTADKVFAIAVNDVNEFAVTTPVDSNAAANAVDENAAIGTVVGVTAFASDADATNHAVSYSLSDNAGGRFAIDASTGVVSVAGGIDREAAPSYDITVVATSADMSTSSKTFSIAVNDVNEFSVTTPTDTNAAANAVNENVAIGTVVGITASSSDADATNHAVSYSLSSNPGGLFAIDAATGVVTTAAAIDREALGASVSITVRATSADTSTADQAFSIAINGLNDNAPTITSNGGGATATVNVAENSTAVTTVSATDADLPAQALSYSIAGGADSAKFAINGTTGALSFITAPNFESPTDAGANNVYDVVVRASDGTLFDDQALAVTVTNVNEAPVNSVPGAQTATEDVSKVISGLSIADVDAGSGSMTLTLAVQHGAMTVGTVGGGASIAGNNTASVTLSGTFAQINASLAALNNVSYKGATNFNGSDTLTMTTSDNGNSGSGGPLTDTDTVAITVSAVNDAPVATNDVLYVSNSTNGVVIAADALLANDTDTDGLNLTILSVGGATSGIQNLTLNANGTVTFDSKNPGAESFTYVVSDNAGGTSTCTVAVNVVSTNGGSTVDLHLISYQAAYLDGGSNNDALTGGAAPDTFIGGAADDTLIGGAGNDIVRGGAGNDTIDGGAGTDLLDLSDATGGVNFTWVQSSSNTSVNLSAVGLGTDVYKNIEGVIGSGADDTLTGSSGADVIRGGNGNDTIDGGAGTDLIDFSDASGAISFTLVQSSSNTSVNLSAVGLGTDSYKNIEGVIGTAFADAINGSSGADVLKGGAGNDTINGGAGNDTIVGGSGADLLTGGTGSDTFMYLKTDAGAVDTITDFDATPGADVLGIGDLLSGYSAVDAAQFVSFRESGSNTIVSIDRDGSGGAFGFQDLVVLQGVTGLDFSTLMAHIDPVPLP